MVLSDSCSDNMVFKIQMSDDKVVESINTVKWFETNKIWRQLWEKKCY